MRVCLLGIFALILSAFNKNEVREIKLIEAKISDKYNWLDLHGLKIKEMVQNSEGLLLQNTRGTNKILVTNKGPIGSKYYLSLVTNTENIIDLSLEVASIEPQTIEVQVNKLPKGLEVIKFSEKEELDSFLQRILSGKEQFEPSKEKKGNESKNLKYVLAGYFKHGKYKALVIEIKNISKKAQQLSQDEVFYAYKMTSPKVHLVDFDEGGLISPKQTVKLIVIEKW
jgi:hypothetical protein